MELEREQNILARRGVASRRAVADLVRAERVAVGGRRLRFVLSEGRHRQICEQAGLRVRRLRRVALSGLTLGGLAPGRFRERTPAEIARLAP